MAGRGKRVAPGGGPRRVQVAKGEESVFVSDT